MSLLANKYRNIIFDCDGVILNSNKIKTEAFYSVALPYGRKYASSLVKYHQVHGGISRYKKFEYFLSDILKTKVNKFVLSELIDLYSSRVKKLLLESEVTDNLNILRSSLDSDWMIVSGGDQDELQDVFFRRGIGALFNNGIYGSPDTKETILKREKGNGKLDGATLLLGDSRYDHEVSVGAGIDFIFVSGWSDFEKWEEYTNQHSIAVIENLNDLLNM